VEEGRFRPDLFYRLNVFPIHLPPLRERKGEIPLLADHFVKKFAASMNKKITRISPAAVNVLERYQWPGNIRELENAIERAMVVGQEPELREQDFALRMPMPGHAARTLEDIEKAHILEVLEECKGNQTVAAEVLDIDRVTLHNKLKKYGWKRVTADVS
jgi:DNA-binding NtrC family response regulator